ncbi:F0F1 ATP synthase subunit delta [Clostridium niameyense]|uniref:ATP synthase subunit delta n=1 Tax=Clostridium niameyense TaxID=1622073 RepID=A0A6M0RB66_9CLOT|nr:F0F1 ATP synthase subunit delta [Clostridium niameyense]NEZ47432.1 F0F1 ATP synthase subunit delta [Clostridium niameyense]
MYEYLDKRYALALYEVAEEKNKVEQYIKELKDIVYMINTNKNIREIIKHPEISTSKKKNIFVDIFKDKIDKELLSFLLVLIEENRILYLEQKLKEMEKIYLDKRNMISAKVKTAVPLLEEEKKQLIDKLQKRYNKNIVLHEEIDKSIIGGVYVRIGDDVIDNTIKTKLQDMKKVMIKG